jgi:catecholate siderophore receptor
MSIKSRKSPVVRPPATFADSRTLGLVLAALPGLAFAAQSDSSEGTERVLRGVVVAEEVEEGYKADAASSPKFTAPLLDTPQTITVLKKELLEDQAAGSLAEALRNTPGITFTLGENGNTTAGDSITMRGFDTSNSIFLDGVRDLGAVSRDVFNTEQIEIVKGPSGSDNGRGAPTGYINMSSKQPTLENAASGTLTAGTANRRRVTADVNYAVEALDGAAFRFNTMYDASDKVGRDVADSGRWAFAPSFAVGLGSSTRAYFNYLYTKQSNTPDGGIPAIGLAGYSSATTSGTPAVNISQSIIDAINGADPVDRDNFYGSKDDYERVHANMFTARIEHDLGANATLRNTSRYGRYSLRRMLTGINTVTVHTGVINNPTSVLAPDAWTVSRSRQLRDEVNEILTNQTNLTTSFNTGFIQHSISSGFEFIYEQQLSRGSTSVGTAQPANLYNPSTADSFATPVLNGAATNGQTITGAAYLFDTLRLSDKWSLNAGLRFDHFRTEYSNAPAPAPAPTTPVAVARTYFEGSGNLVTGKVGLVFKPFENASIYAAYATSEQPPGGANFQLSAGDAANANNPNLDPQKARNIELGTKWDLLENRLVLTAAVFDTRNKNDLAQADPNNAGEIIQYGERKVRGIELSASGMITPSWQVSAGFASLDAEVVEGSRLADGTPNPAGTQGADLTFTPKLSFTSWTTYKFPFGLTIGGGGRYTDSQYRNGNATQATQANLAVNPDAWVFDVMAGYDVNEERAYRSAAECAEPDRQVLSLQPQQWRFALRARPAAHHPPQRHLQVLSGPTTAMR